MSVRAIVDGLGRILMTAGTLILLFVAYQLWGTGLAESRAQDDLQDEFAERIESTPVDPTKIPPPPPEGEAVAMIKIPKINVEKAVVEGVGVGDLKKGPGHYPQTPLPGQPGNAAIAGHRTTYGAPFGEVESLQPGDPILVSTLQGQFRYEVRETKVVTPSQVEVLDPTEDNRLTLTTCHPRFSAAKRLIVVAELKGDAAVAPPPPDRSEPRGVTSIDDAGLSGESAARTPAILWGVAATAVWLVAWFVAKRFRKLVVYAVSVPVFLVVLFFFFENFARLLPANA